MAFISDRGSSACVTAPQLRRGRSTWSHWSSCWGHLRSSSPSSGPRLRRGDGPQQSGRERRPGRGVRGRRRLRHVDRHVLERPTRSSGPRPDACEQPPTGVLPPGADEGHPRQRGPPPPASGVWTFDKAGLHGWTPERDGPVLDVPWSRIHRVGLATKDSRGTRVDYALWFGLDGGDPLVLAPRTALGRPFEAGRAGLETLLPVVRALRRELDHRPRSRSTAR